MSKANLKVVTIEASSKEEAIQQLREQLDGDVPQDIIDKMVESITEVDSDAPNKERRSYRGKKISPSDTLDFVASLRDLPVDKRKAALEDHIVELGATYGLSREDALEQANDTKAKVDGILSMLGIKIPESQQGPFGGAKTGPATAVKDDFDTAADKLKAAGVTDQQFCHIGQFYKHQDELVDSMQFLFHLADDHGHRPSAMLFQQIDDYINATDTWLYDTCEKAGVNPESFGFSKREEYAERNGSLNRIRQTVAKVLDSKPAASFA